MRLLMINVQKKSTVNGTHQHGWVLGGGRGPTHRITQATPPMNT